jgi:hypothetical protein
VDKRKWYKELALLNFNIIKENTSSIFILFIWNFIQILIN